MATQAQINANRTNAKKSTGPQTPEGKAAARTNALRHGLQAKILLTAAEDEEKFNSLVDDLVAEWQPATATEQIVFSKMVEQYWISLRGAALLAKETDAGDTKKIALMLRYASQAERAFYRGLHELQKLRKTHDLEEIGFVSETAEEVVEPEPEPAPEPLAEPLPEPADLPQPVPPQPESQFYGPEYAVTPLQPPVYDTLMS
jgi:hypothetical protein